MAELQGELLLGQYLRGRAAGPIDLGDPIEPKSLAEKSLARLFRILD